MSISRQTRILENYDPYGIHRVNGIKVLYIVCVLFGVNFVVGIPNPYFYFFYAPLTALFAEVLGTTLKEKYQFFIFSALGSCCMIFIFDTLRVYPLLFLLFGFTGSLSLYLIILKKNRRFMPIIPIILSLSAYSLLYQQGHGNFYIILRNATIELVAILIILGALSLFPTDYYYRIWLRAFLALVTNTSKNFLLTKKQKSHQIELIHRDPVNLLEYSGLISRQLPTYSIMKITFLMNRLYILSCAATTQHLQLDDDILYLTIQHLRQLRKAIRQEKPCQPIEDHAQPLSQLIRSWNYLCTKI